MDPVIYAIGIGVLLVAFIMFLMLVRPSQATLLLEEVAREGSQEEQPATPATGWRAHFNIERLAKPFGWSRNLFGMKTDPLLVRRLLLAGYRKQQHAEIYVTSKLILPVFLGLAVAFLVKSNVIFWFLLVIAISFFLPDFWLIRAINKRRENIKLSLPDALDLLAICMEAGLGLDQAVVRVGTELRMAHPDLSDELLQINLVQRAGHPRLGAWRDMADRVDVEAVRSFVNMLVQTERFGTPISKSLGLFSDALRTRRRQQAEELAAKTTIKLVIPLVFFIFPSIFIVTVAPAVIIVMKSFGTIV